MDVINAILCRKSIRYFKPYTIPEGEVQLLLECCRFAPSGGNCQPWEFLVMEDREDFEKIYDFGWKAYGGGFNVCRFGDASLMVFFLGSAQCYLAAENLALAAYGLGYGSCLIRGFDAEKTRALLGIPEDKKIQVCVVVGLADEARSNAATFTVGEKTLAGVLPYPPEARKPLKELVHLGRYGKSYAQPEPERTREKIVGGFKEG